MPRSGPYRIRRAAVQLELDDGRIMTFYADETNAHDAQVTIDTVHAGAHDFQRLYPPRDDVKITVDHLHGYIMKLQQPGTGPDPLTAGQKELTP